VGSNSNYTDKFGKVWRPDDGFFTPSKAIDEDSGRTNRRPAIAIDITAASGGARAALVVPIEGIQVNDGVLNLEFKAEKDFGAISAIGVYSSPS
jgi:hypothetical protein